MAGRHLGPIEVERIFLYDENPRHEPIETEPEIIEHLCKDEQVYNLARSISDAGPNPLDLLGLVEIPGAGKKKNYQCWEGNRRVCAIKLLNDPDRAPPHLRKDFARLASSAHIPIKNINCVVFDDHDDLKFWMAIIHDGAQGGVGRKNWSAEQKARHFGASNRNRAAQAVLDVAESMNLITKEERRGKLTTAQRFLNSSVVKEAIGIDTTNLDDVTYNRPTEDFQKQLGRFISDLKDGVRVNSRKDRAQVDTYGRALARSKDISGERIQPRSLKTAAAGKLPAKSKRKSKPKEPRKLTNLEYSNELATALEAVRSNKLERLYYSVCSVGIQHTPLLTVGVWAFVESLCALDGKKPETDFVAYYSNQKCSDLGFRKAVDFREALTRIQRNGNATKHHETAATFDGQQLSNDLETITPLLMKTLEKMASKK